MISLLILSLKSCYCVLSLTEHVLNSACLHSQRQELYPAGAEHISNNGLFGMYHSRTDERCYYGEYGQGR